MASMASKAIKVSKKTIGYLRVSTDKQSAKRQKSDILEYANEKKLGNVEIVSEIISSRKADREIYSLIERLGKGDKIIITELSRIGRSMKEINYIVSHSQKKGISIYVQNQDLKIDNTIQAQAIVFALSLSAQIERDLISERTKSALRERKKMGIKLGRPVGKGQKLEKYFKINPLEKEKYILLRNAGLSYNKIAKSIGMSQVQVAQYFHRIEKEKEKIK